MLTDDGALHPAMAPDKKSHAVQGTGVHPVRKEPFDMRAMAFIVSACLATSGIGCAHLRRTVSPSSGGGDRQAGGREGEKSREKAQ